MTKRIIALLLALILTVGLLPTVALAAEGETLTTDSGSVTKEASKDNLKLVKTVTKEGDNYKVTLESWATGTVTTTTETKPLDIVLLLDVSGSMDDKYSNETIDKYVPYDYKWYGGPILGGYNTTNSDLYDYQSTRYGVWYKIPNSETYVSVNVKYEWKLLADDEYTYSYEQNGKTILIEKTSNRNKPPKTQFYYKESADTTKLDALKTAVSAFIDNVATNSPNSNISIVKFADNSYKNAEGNDTFWQGDYEYNYTQIVKKLTKVDKNGVTALKKAIGELKAGGATASDYGLNKAQEALNGAKQERVVILFTDGEPNHGRDFDKEVATAAVNKAKELKTAETKTTIYTVGVFKNLYEDVNLYMSSVSSNYPNASAQYKKGTWKVSYGGSDFGKYYMNATSPVDLLKAFETISSEVSGGELGEKAVLTDVIAPNFALVAPEGTNGVTAYTVDKTADGWSTQKTTLTNGVTVGTDGQVNVTGFNYSENCVTTTAKPNTSNDYGKKLVVEFTIAHNNYGGTQPTNAGASIKDEEGKEVIKVDDPTIPVKITEPSITSATATKVYDGEGIDVIANIKAAADALVTGTNKGKNQFVTISVAVKVDENTTYTYTIPAGAESGSWDSTTPTLTTGKDVNTYKYDLTITYTDATPKTDTTTPAEPKTATAEATYTITKRPVTLTSETASKPYDGTPLTKQEVTVTDYDDGKNVFNSEFTAAATGTITEPGGPVANTITVTPKNGALESNYEITKKEGNLTITQDETTKITVTITGKNTTKEYDGTEHVAEGYDVSVSGANASDVRVSLNTGKQAKANGTDVKSASEDNGEYRMGLTKDDFTVTSNKYKNIEVTYTDGYVKITPAQVTLTSGTASKDYDGTPLTREAVTVTGTGKAVFEREVTEIKATGTVTDPGPAVDNTITYTPGENFKESNYNISKSEGKLSINDIAGPTNLPTVTVHCTNTEVVHADSDGNALTNGSYTSIVSKNATSNSYICTVTLTDKSGYINAYNTSTGATHVSDTSKTDTTKIVLTYDVTNKTWNAPTESFFLNVKCDTPTTTVDLGTYVKKTLKGDNFHENFKATFTVNVSYGSDETAVGTVELTGAAVNVPFTFSNITLKQGFYYIFTVTEQEANVPGVTCDTTIHEFALNVKTDGTVEFGSVVENQFVPAGAESDQFLTITNTYTEPKEPSVVSKTVVTTDMVDTLLTSVSNDIAVFKSINKVDILYPVVNGETSTLEVPYGTKSVTLLYKITVNAGTKTSMQFEDVGAECVSIVDDDDVDVSQAGRTFTVQFFRGVTTADIYVAKTYTNLVFDSNGECVVFNTVAGHRAETTVKVPDPNKLTINFADYVKKELTATGTKTASDVDFTVDVKEFKTVISSIQGEEEVNTYAGEQLLSTTLNAHFDSITGGETKTAPFNGSIVVEHAGTYSFELTEEDGQRTGVTYDDSTYKVYVYVKREGDKLVVGSFDIYKDGWGVAGETITFHNTIDTGKDDYYPIIIPTIINKDTGMLNKTDHFAYVIGYPDGTVHPNGQITRAEVATIFFRLLRDEVRDGAFTTSNTYSDVAYGKWYNNPISTMSALGIITGYPDGTFKPNKPITRAEFAAIAARFDETQSGKSATFSDVIGHWAAKEIGIAYYNDWIKGYPDGTFKPDQNITRAEAMTLINRVLERKPESPADLLTNMNKWTDNMDTSKWYYLDVQEATNSHGYTRKTFNYELWRQMLPDPDWSRYEC